ncbi:hypothetical protein L0F63_006317, partial [Massospora cicadina]
NFHHDQGYLGPKVPQEDLHRLAVHRVLCHEHSLGYLLFIYSNSQVVKMGF